MIVFESDFNGDINGDSAVEAEDGHDQDNGSDPCSGGHNRTGSEVHSMMHIGCLFCSDEIQALRLVLHNRRSHGLKAVLNALLAGAGPKVVCTQQQILSVANANIERCSVQREQVVFRVELNEDPQEAYAHARQLVLSWSKHGCPGHDAQVPASNSVILSSHILARVPVFQTLQPGTLACISSSQFAVKAGINSIEKLGRKDSAAFRFSQEPLIRTFANHSMNTPVRNCSAPRFPRRYTSRSTHVTTFLWSRPLQLLLTWTRWRKGTSCPSGSACFCRIYLTNFSTFVQVTAYTFFGWQKVITLQRFVVATA